ncbi:MAG: hypothetical protein MJY62_03430 [Bacteroidales bacterium]|nr:hypothetical protein [Bacteroidales bacterium]
MFSGRRNKIFGILMAGVLLFLLPVEVSAQFPGRRSSNGNGNREDQDSLVRLMYADTLQLITIGSKDYRQVFGHPAQFLHNGTYLYCESAIWDVESQIINAKGNVRIVQDGTTLTSERSAYWIERDLAEFRGTLVQLEDEDGNLLRTHYLDYNTKDSVAIFTGGASMKDKDGNIIESIDGRYDSKINTFEFSGNVNMFTDSVFIRTPELVYESDSSLATFKREVHMWQEDNMLSSRYGWYNSDSQTFFFTDHVHGLARDQEQWSDSLYIYRGTGNVNMYGHVQILDTTRNALALAGAAEYVDSLSRLTMMRRPAVVALVDDENNPGQLDSAFIGADSIICVSRYRFEVDSAAVNDAGARLSSVDVDPVTELRVQAAAKAAEEAAKAAEEDPNNAANAAKRAEEYAKQKALEEENAAQASSANMFQRIKAKISERKTAKAAAKAAKQAMLDSLANLSSAVDSTALADSLSSIPDSLATGLDSLSAVLDSLDMGLGTNSESSDSLATDPDSFAAALDSLAAGLDSLQLDSLHRADSIRIADSLAAIVPDSTRITFLTALSNVRIFRENMQVRCDSLEYSDLDSLARLYNSPKIWNEIRHQYVADSIYAVIRGNAMEKAHLLSNAFIHIQEDTLHYDQIRSAEMTAYFASAGTLSRFDALGGAVALFFIEENDAIATSNRKECRMLSATFKDGDIERVHYYEDVKSDASPVAQMTREDKIIKGFVWTPEDRPASRYDITPWGVRRSERYAFENVQKANFAFTKNYFPGYIENINQEIKDRIALKEFRKAEKARLKALEAEAAADTLAHADSLAAKDSLVAASDTLAPRTPSDSTSVAAADSLSTASDSISVAAEVREPTAAQLRAQERERKKAEKAEARKARQELAQARWDAKEAERQKKIEARREAKLEKERQKKLKILRTQSAREVEEQAKVRKYINKYVYERY